MLQQVRMSFSKTATLQLVNLTHDDIKGTARAIMDGGSQRSYITDRLRRGLNLLSTISETLQIETFGSQTGQEETCDLTQFGIGLKNGSTLEITALVVPTICSPLISQPINLTKETHSHLVDLELADTGELGDLLEVDILIGSDWYWSIITGKLIRGNSGPIAIDSKVGWILSGPTTQRTMTNLTLSATHALKINTCVVDSSLDKLLKRFWELETIGVEGDESPAYNKFLQKISFDGNRYEVGLPWKEHHSPLPDHYCLCLKRLNNLLKRLRQTPQLLQEYDKIICDQIQQGIVERAPSLAVKSERLHYLPHHGVVRQDKSTSKLRIVYDASARSTGPTLNDCLYTGPKFNQSIFDILLRFRLNQIALIGDIEKAFLMVSVQREDRDSLRFLWTPNADAVEFEPIELRFTRVVFGVSASPFLLNATIDHHIENYQVSDPEFVKTFRNSIYVDDLVSGGDDVPAAYEFYLKCKLRLAEAGFNLRKFLSNSQELQERIGAAETTQTVTAKDDDQSYAKTALGAGNSDSEVTKVLGVQWDPSSDVFIFDASQIASVMKTLEPTKRNLVSITAKFFDPLGIVSPVTVLFKMLCQRLCVTKTEWDEVMTGENLIDWNQLLKTFEEAEPIVIPRCVYIHAGEATRLVGFCDASTKAYAAIVYLEVVSPNQRSQLVFLAAKTRVTPLNKTTIPRLELLSALLLAKLITNIKEAMRAKSTSLDLICFTDSKATFYWIRGVHNEWKQFVQNRVIAIRNLVSSDLWWHCPGSENPADIPSRGMDCSKLVKTSAWLNGPEWYYQFTENKSREFSQQEYELPEECQDEMKRSDPMFSLIAASEGPPGICALINMHRYSSPHKLFRVTALVLKFVNALCNVIRKEPRSTEPCESLSTPELERARTHWMKYMQGPLVQSKDFHNLIRRLDMFADACGIWRCGGRMQNSSLPMEAINPILIPRDHYVTRLLVLEAHRRVLHNGVRETLAELRSQYWLIRGRQIVKKILRYCVTCRKLEGQPCKGMPSPPLPDFRVKQSRPFETTGVDFAGPLYLKSQQGSGGRKAWLVLYTCCSTRAVHLDLVCDMSAATFLRSFKRFTARRGLPSRMISDNAKTFKSAAGMITSILNSAHVTTALSNIRVQWQFNLEKAPWWGGIFERMIQSAKRCLRKVIKGNCLDYDELITLVIEVECVLNSRPLTYVYSEDTTEPLTPSHLLTGFRLLSLPDSGNDSDKEDYTYTPEGVTRRASHLATTLQHFWKRWKREYLLELRNFHQVSKASKTDKTLKVGEVVTVYDENQPRGLWRIGRVESLIHGADGVVRGVSLKVMSKTGISSLIRRPIQHIYPLEVRVTPAVEVLKINEESGKENPMKQSRPARQAAEMARVKIIDNLLD